MTTTTATPFRTTKDPQENTHADNLTFEEYEQINDLFLKNPDSRLARDR